MKRDETIKVLSRILQQRENDMDALQAAIEGLRIAIAEVERATDDAVTTPQKGTYKQELTDAMYGILCEHGPLHRNTILEKVKELGLHVGGGVSTVGSYLSVDDRFKSAGKGTWMVSPPPSEATKHSLPEPSPQSVGFINQDFTFVSSGSESEIDNLPF